MSGTGFFSTSPASQDASVVVIVKADVIPLAGSASLSSSSFPAFATVNFGVFSQYSSFFYQNAGQILVAVALAHILSAIYYFTGFVVTPKEKQADRLAAGVSLAMVNNILVIVFSSGFFGPLCPTLAAMYVFPFFTMIVPVKLILNYTGLLSAPRQSDNDVE